MKTSTEANLPKHAKLLQVFTSICILGSLFLLVSKLNFVKLETAKCYRVTHPSFTNVFLIRTAMVDKTNNQTAVHVLDLSNREAFYSRVARDLRVKREVSCVEFMQEYSQLQALDPFALMGPVLYRDWHTLDAVELSL